MQTAIQLFLRHLYECETINKLVFKVDLSKVGKFGTCERKPIVGPARASSSLSRTSVRLVASSDSTPI